MHAIIARHSKQFYFIRFFKLSHYRTVAIFFNGAAMGLTLSHAPKHLYCINVANVLAINIDFMSFQHVVIIKNVWKIIAKKIRKQKGAKMLKKNHNNLPKSQTLNHQLEEKPSNVDSFCEHKMF